jgi:hypothetical protein
VVGGRAPRKPEASNSSSFLLLPRFGRNERCVVAASGSQTHVFSVLNDLPVCKGIPRKKLSRCIDFSGYKRHPLRVAISSAFYALILHP